MAKTKAPSNATGKPPFSPANPQIVEHESWGAFLTYAETAPATVAESTRSSRRERDDSWCGASWENTLKLARDGWTDGESKVRDISRRLEARILHRIVRDDINYDVEGMQFDVARYLEGEPEHWIKPEESTMLAEHGNRHIKLVLCVSASNGVSADVIMARGATVAALVELLEYADHRVELWTVDASSKSYAQRENTPPVHVTTVRVKAFDQPVEMGRIAFALAHPAMLRRLGFSARECAHPSIVDSITAAHAYGYPAEYRPDDASLYLPACKLWDDSCNWQSPESGEAWILGKLAEQGIVLRDD